MFIDWSISGKKKKNGDGGCLLLKLPLIPASYPLAVLLSSKHQDKVRVGGNTTGRADCQCSTNSSVKYGSL